MLMVFAISIYIKNMENKNIYIVISQTGTILSRALKAVTGAKYNHASISLSENLETMYSFGRKNAYNPFWAGFVIEAPNTGTFKRFHKTKALVMELEIDEDNYHALCQRIEKMLDCKEKYQFNYLGIVLAAFGICRHKENCYYCSEFVKELAQCYKFEGAQELDKIVHPIHFMKLPHKVIYTGKINDYNKRDAS